MNTCILLFTKDCDDPYTMKRQVESLVKEYGGYDNVKIIEKDTRLNYATIDEEIENAKLERMKNFIVLEDPKNFVALDVALNEEYGDCFEEIKAVSEVFKRLEEAAPSESLNPTGNINDIRTNPIVQDIPNVKNVNKINLICFDASFLTKTNVDKWVTLYKQFAQEKAKNVVLPAEIIDGQQYIGGQTLSLNFDSWPYKNLYINYGLQNMHSNNNRFIDYKDEATLSKFLTAILLDLFSNKVDSATLSDQITLNLVGANIGKFEGKIPNKIDVIAPSGNKISAKLTWNICNGSKISPPICYDASKNKEIYDLLIEMDKHFEKPKENELNIEKDDNQSFKKDSDILMYINNLIETLKVLANFRAHSVDYNKKHDALKGLKAYISSELSRAEKIFSDSSVEVVAGLAKLALEKIPILNNLSDASKLNTKEAASARKKAIIFNHSRYLDLCKILELDTAKRR